MLSGQTSDGKPMLVAITLDGREIWSKAMDGIVRNVKTHDIDGGGVHTIAGLCEGKIVVLNGGNGKEKAKRLYPETGPFQGLRGDQAFLDALYIAHLRPGDQARDIIVKECDPGGGHSCWCYDEGLNLLWSKTVDQPRHGHHFGFYDFDGDGLEEICAGYHLLGPEGEVRWRIEGGLSFEVFQYGRHADSCAGGDFDGDGWGEVAIAGGSEGFFLCDGITGEVISRHHIGHAQGLSVASFRSDLPGLEIQVGTRWGNYGIRAFYSGKGAHLKTFQPDLLGQQGEPVNWSGDDGELMFLGSSLEVFGLWDAFGRKVVDFMGMEGDILPEVRKFQVYQGIRKFDDFKISQILFFNVTGDPRDEILVVRDGELLVYTQDANPPNPNRIYSPVRHRRLGNPKVSYPGWLEID